MCMHLGAGNEQQNDCKTGVQNVLSPLRGGLHVHVGVRWILDKIASQCIIGCSNIVAGTMTAARQSKLLALILNQFLFIGWSISYSIKMMSESQSREPRYSSNPIDS